MTRIEAQVIATKIDKQNAQEKTALNLAATLAKFVVNGSKPCFVLTTESLNQIYAVDPQLPATICNTESVSVIFLKSEKDNAVFDTLPKSAEEMILPQESKILDAFINNINTDIEDVHVVLVDTKGKVADFVENNGLHNIPASKMVAISNIWNYAVA